jgi:hypothetical protein
LFHAQNRDTAKTHEYPGGVKGDRNNLGAARAWLNNRAGGEKQVIWRDCDWTEGADDLAKLRISPRTPVKSVDLALVENWQSHYGPLEDNLTVGGLDDRRAS